jgi:hypothetical protein
MGPHSCISPSRVSVFLGLTGILFTIAHVSESPIGELLQTDSGRDRCQYGWMRKKRRQPNWRSQSATIRDTKSCWPLHLA